MKILFLDIDGVLNSIRWYTQRPQERKDGSYFQRDVNEIDPSAVALLDQVIDATGAKIVISSSWRRHNNIESIKGILAYCGFKNSAAIISETPLKIMENDQEVYARKRGQEIQWWLDVTSAELKIQVDKYAILDDSVDFLDYQQPFFVHTDDFVGLVPKDVQKLILLLA